jgi:hypothetical protein
MAFSAGFRRRIRSRCSSTAWTQVSSRLPTAAANWLAVGNFVIGRSPATQSHSAASTFAKLAARIVVESRPYPPSSSATSSMCSAVAREHQNPRPTMAFTSQRCGVASVSERPTARLSSQLLPG